MPVLGGMWAAHARIRWYVGVYIYISVSVICSYIGEYSEVLQTQFTEYSRLWRFHEKSRASTKENHGYQILNWSSMKKRMAAVELKQKS